MGNGFPLPRVQHVETSRPRLIKNRAAPGHRPDFSACGFEWRLDQANSRLVVSETDQGQPRKGPIRRSKRSMRLWLPTGDADECDMARIGGRRWEHRIS